MSRSFKAASAERRGEPYEFTIEGEGWSEEFSVSRNVPGMMFLEAVSASERQDWVTGLRLMFDSMAAVFDEPADFRRFRDACTRARWEPMEIAENIQAIIADLAGRPTLPPSDSAESPSNGGPGSQVNETSPDFPTSPI